MNSIFMLPDLVRQVYMYERDTDPDYKTLSCVSVFFGIILYIANLNNLDNLAMVISAYVVGTALVLMPLVLRRVENKRLFLTWFMIILNFILTVYMLMGVNDGCSSYWALLNTVTSFVVFGMTTGFLVCTYFSVVAMVFFWTPVRDTLPYRYSDSYCTYFPLLFLIGFFIAFVGNLFIKKFRIDQEVTNATLKVELKDAIRDIDQTMVDSVAIISKLIDEKDYYTKEHSVRVARYSRKIAERYGDSRKKEDLDRIYNAALLHDIGKIAVPDNILKKCEQLNDEEYEIMKKHTIWGEEILKDLEFVPDADAGAKFHHERLDGKGYPNGVTGDMIPITGKIISVADTLDAMNSERVYRKPCSREYITKALKDGRGTQFDATLVDIVCDLIDEGEIKIIADRKE